MHMHVSGPLQLSVQGKTDYERTQPEVIYKFNTKSSLIELRYNIHIEGCHKCTTLVPIKVQYTCAEKPLPSSTLTLL